MEPVTHTLTSVALSRAGLNRTTRHATTLLVISGLGPDLDLLSYAGGASAYVRFYRTIFHSLPGALALACGLAGLATVLDRRFRHKQGQPGLHFARVFLVCAIGVVSHLLLDLCDSNGVNLLWPFRNRWVAWDFAPQVDPWILVLLLAGLSLPELFRLVSEEIGERKKGRGPSKGAIAALVLIAGYLVARGELHSRAVDMLLSREYHGLAPLAAGAFPSGASPLAWRGVVSTENSLEILDVSFAPGAEFDPERSLTHFKPESSPVLEAAQRTTVAQRFLRKAQFPIASLERIEEGYRCELRDLRFRLDSPSFGEVFAVVELDKQLQVTREELRFASAGR